MATPRKGNNGVCSKCGRAIVWIKTPAGKWMPTDAGPVFYKANPEGKDILVDDKGFTIRCDTQFDGPPDGYARRSHFATCTKAADFKKRK